MAKPSTKITKTVFTNNYNIDKILTNKTDIMKQLQSFNSTNQAVAFGTKKQPKDTMPSWFKEFEERLNTRLDKIETTLDEHTQLFKQHGWLK